MWRGCPSVTALDLQVPMPSFSSLALPPATLAPHPDARVPCTTASCHSNPPPCLLPPATLPPYSSCVAACRCWC